VICARPLESIGFSRTHRALAVSDGCRGFFSSDTVRRLVAQAVSSSRKLAASSECFYLRPAPSRADIQAGSRRVRLPWSSRSLMTTSEGRIVTAPGVPFPDAFRPWRSSRLRRFHPRPTLRVYFTPQPFQDSLFKGFPSHTATTPRRRRSAFVSVPLNSLHAVAHVRRSLRSRLQGFAPCESPLSKRRCLAAVLPAPFLSFPSSRCCSLPQPRRSFTPCFRSSPYKPSVESSNLPAYSVLRTGGLTGPSRDLPTCARF